MLETHFHMPLERLQLQILLYPCFQKGNEVLSNFLLHRPAVLSLSFESNFQLIVISYAVLELSLVPETMNKAI